ncbi:hypothetical protein Slala03_74590 [Streptomyces lavendulae subsp. lavendulae]|uniref:hypothetical protein n=1 Tax=Streptomyces lavendulae TaxID=1914 RepID=UPI0024A0B8C8|nr:hypothetical protein [Streptomyces lavendulae]GLV87770.1 hypothetical protein Slala03_74590 [Streptomyces lavendulae subsp. lavendulae]
MSEDAQQRKERADRLREMIQRPGAEPEPPEQESLKEGVERRMRELDEADREDHRNSPNRQDDQSSPETGGEDGEP